MKNICKGKEFRGRRMNECHPGDVRVNDISLQIPMIHGSVDMSLPNITSTVITRVDALRRGLHITQTIPQIVFQVAVSSALAVLAMNHQTDVIITMSRPEIAGGDNDFLRELFGNPNHAGLGNQKASGQPGTTTITKDKEGARIIRDLEGTFAQALDRITTYMFYILGKELFVVFRKRSPSCDNKQPKKD